MVAGQIPNATHAIIPQVSPEKRLCDVATGMELGGRNRYGFTMGIGYTRAPGIPESKKSNHTLFEQKHDTTIKCVK